MTARRGGAGRRAARRGGLRRTALRLRALAPLLALAGLPPPGVAAQGVLTRGSARIDASAPDRIRVELAYDFELDGTADAVPFEGLAFRPAEIEALEAAGEGGPAPLALHRTPAGRLTADLPLAAGRSGPFRVRLAYDVVGGREGDDPWRIRIPVLAPGWPSREALPGTFRVEASFPAAWTLFEPFPSGLVEEEGVDGRVRHTLDLPAVPALLSMRATTGAPALGGMVQLLDGLVLLVLGALTVAGWVHFRTAP